jgi:hypothetical protein
MVFLSVQRHVDESSGHHGEDGEDHHAEGAAAHGQVQPALQHLVLGVPQYSLQQGISENNVFSLLLLNLSLMYIGEVKAVFTLATETR